MNYIFRSKFARVIGSILLCLVSALIFYKISFEMKEFITADPSHMKFEVAIKIYPSQTVSIIPYLEIDHYCSEIKKCSLFIEENDIKFKSGKSAQIHLEDLSESAKKITIFTHDSDYDTEYSYKINRENDFTEFRTKYSSAMDAFVAVLKGMALVFSVHPIVLIRRRFTKMK